MIAYLDERPLNTLPRTSSFTLSELEDIVYEGYDDTIFILEVSIAVEDTDCEVYGLTSDGYINYPLEYIVHEKVDGTTGYTVLLNVSDLVRDRFGAFNNQSVTSLNLSVGDLTTLKRVIGLLSE